jgi:hypothetical protein
MSRRRRFKQFTEPTRCKCEGGADRAQQHAKPHAKAADHGNPFKRTDACIHSELQLTSRGARKSVGVQRLRFM